MPISPNFDDGMATAVIRLLLHAWREEKTSQRGERDRMTLQTY